MSAYGDRALLIELDGLDDVLALHAALRESRPVGVIDLVPAARTVTVMIEPSILPLETARSWASRVAPGDGALPGDRLVEIDVDYSGEDLDETARLAGMTVDELISLHSSSIWRVAFGGFAPGFGYLVTDHHRLDVPRRATPRTSVPAGAVALAGGFGGVYPRTGPGGWQIIGHTDAAIWDERRDPPALLAPGTRVRFRAVPHGAVRPGGRLAEVGFRGLDTRAPSSLATRPAEGPGGRVATEQGPGGRVASERSEHAYRDPAITVITPGMSALIEDLGRPGNASIGAARSGALDRGALRLANRLLGNDESSAALELLYGGAEFRVERPVWFVVTGARGPVALRGASAPPRPVEPDAPTHADAGDTLMIGVATAGMRYVLALRGGVVAPTVLGSRSRDVGAAIGPQPLAAGNPVAVGIEPASGIPPIDALTVPPPPTGTVTVRVHPGARADWFTADAIARFFETEWRVSTEGNRIGVRLVPGAATEEVPLIRSRADELPSEAMVPGAIQVPPSGMPVVLLADHPTTGGYPVIAIVADADLDLFAQLRPGQGVRFRHAR